MPSWLLSQGFQVNPTPELFGLEEAGSQKFAFRPRNFCDPTSSNQNNSGGVHQNFFPIRPQLRALQLVLTRVIKDGSDPRCRECGNHDETAGHILSACADSLRSFSQDSWSPLAVLSGKAND